MNKQDALSIFNFEQWVYEHEELEGIFGVQEYFEFISRDYKDKFAYHEIERQIRRLVRFGLFEQERITNMLNDLLINEQKSEQLEILGILYEEYCSGYNFLRYIALSYIQIDDEYEYSDYRTEKDQIELHSINEMLGAN